MFSSEFSDDPHRFFLSFSSDEFVDAELWNGWPSNTSIFRFATCSGIIWYSYSTNDEYGLFKGGIALSFIIHPEGVSLKTVNTPQHGQHNDKALNFRGYIPPIFFEENHLPRVVVGLLQILQSRRPGALELFCRAAADLIEASLLSPSEKNFRCLVGQGKNPSEK